MHVLFIDFCFLSRFSDKSSGNCVLPGMKFSLDLIIVPIWSSRYNVFLGIGSFHLKWGYARFLKGFTGVRIAECPSRVLTLSP